MPRIGAATTGSLIDFHTDQQTSGPAVLNLSEPGPFMSPVFSSRDRASRSRQSSVSSQEASGDARLYSPVAAAAVRAVRQYALPSDAESSVGGDTDDAAIPDAENMQQATKEELLHYYARMQQRAVKYRSRFSQVNKSRE